MTNCVKNLKCCLSALLIGAIGALLCLTDASRLYLEEGLGLSCLFRLRGELSAPENVVIISIDRASAEILRLPENPENWPRSFYARLIDKINQQNPAVIAFNIYFGEARNKEDDELLAKAMNGHENIILSSYIKQLPSLDQNHTDNYERIIDPIAVLDEAALAAAPFPLRKNADPVKQFWTYRQSAGDIPTFPATTFQHYVFKEVYPEILHLLEQINPHFYAELPKNFPHNTGEFNALEIFQQIQTTFSNDPSLSKKIVDLLKTTHYGTPKNRLINAWLSFLVSNDSLYLNHYGKPGTVTTIPFYQALVMDILHPHLFRNKVVLVGYSEDIEPEKNQGFYTSFSGQQSVSAVEIAATATANLIENSWLKPLSLNAQVLLIVIWSLLLSAVFRFSSYKNALVLAIALGVAYGMFTYYRFVSANAWLPWVIPTLQTLSVIGWETLTHIFKIKKVSERYLPEGVFEKNTQNPDAMHQYGTLMYGVCMATDAGQYTTLSETMSPSDLNVLMNNYYAAMFPKVKKHQGIISDVIGDAMLALWAKPFLSRQVRINACLAALAIRSAINEFNRSGLYQLPTRLGLHYGEMRLGNVGAIDHYEYRAIGDCINTATRIEGLNKILGTQILVSSAVIQGLSDFISREIGVFILKGKTQPLTIFELLDHNQDWQPLIVAFNQALMLFRNQQWVMAKQAFQAIQKDYPQDGPTRFYLQYLASDLTQVHNLEQPVIIEIGNITA